jgi:hypothetical protein
LAPGALARYDFGMAHQIFETFSDSILVFLGEGGNAGVLRRLESGAWQHLQAGSKEWDYFHQLVYRNFKADELTEQELALRGIALPDLEAYASKAKPVAWSQNFDGEVSFESVNPEVLADLLARPSPQALFVVLIEDAYESAFGDGVALDAEAAFLDEAPARAFLDYKNAENEKRKKDELGYRFTLKSISVSVDTVQRQVVAQLNIEKYEHYTLAGVLELLGRTPGQQ